MAVYRVQRIQKLLRAAQEVLCPAEQWERLRPHYQALLKRDPRDLLVVRGENISRVSRFIADVLAAESEQEFQRAFAEADPTLLVLVRERVVQVRERLQALGPGVRIELPRNRVDALWVLLLFPRWEEDRLLPPK